SNGADYHYTMTLIHTQRDKLGGELGSFLRETMVPAIYCDMAARGWPTSPFVHPVRESPDDGIRDILDTPRFSTGYAALHHTIGFMPETHMQKPFAERYASTRALVESVLAFSIAHGSTIQALRREARQQAACRTRWPVFWQPDFSRPRAPPFKGFAARYKSSKLGNYQRLWYDRQQPWEREIAFYDRCSVDIEVDTPSAYLVPRAWREVIERLSWNKVQWHQLPLDETRPVRTQRITSVTSRATPYEGHLFHDALELTTQLKTCLLRAGDCVVPLNQPDARYAVETLEPQGHDSFFRWGFFNSILEKKEHYSDYVFEDLAWDMLQDEPALMEKFLQWKSQHPGLVGNQKAVLDFIFANGKRFAEPGWMRYPVFGLVYAALRA
ncbi:MAG: peptidase M14, partial [Rhodoferax sp.]|nr:peptidase M14 [Rhodoferax sp.]